MNYVEALPNPFRDPCAPTRESLELVAKLIESIAAPTPKVRKPNKSVKRPQRR